MKLAFYFSLACTARCAHCITFAAPKVRRKMSLEEARRVVEQVAAAPKLKGIVFTGGENLMHKQEMLELVQLCQQSGLVSEIITNAFWGTSRRVAHNMIEPFIEAGVGLFRISIDRYHLPYVPAESVRTALETLAELGLYRSVTCVIDLPDDEFATRGLRRRLAAGEIVPGAGAHTTVDALAASLQGDWPTELFDLLEVYGIEPDDCFSYEDAVELRQRGFDHIAEEVVRTKILVQYQSLATEGRGRELLAETPSQHIDEMPEMPCDSVGNTPTLNPEGDMFPCCSSWVNFKDQKLGNFGETDLGEFLERASNDPIALFMYHQGPGVLIKYLRERGHDLPTNYTHVCHQCGTLLENLPRAELLQLIEDFYRDQPWRMMFTSRGFNLVLSADSPITGANA